MKGISFKTGIVKEGNYRKSAFTNCSFIIDLQLKNYVSCLTNSQIAAFYPVAVLYQL